MSTVALYKALVNAGASEDLADKATEGLLPPETIATKTDIVEVKTDIAEVKNTIHALEVRLIKWNLALASIIIAAITLVTKL